MFGKKQPAPPRAPWTVRVLTLDFVIDGYLNSDEHPESWPFFTPQTEAGTTGTLWLDAPRFTPIAAGAGAPPAVNQWLIPFDSSFLAVMPLDEASLAATRQNVASFKHPFPAVLLAGPYVVHGQLLSNYDDVPNLAVVLRHRLLMVHDATVAPQGPGSALPGLTAPLLLLNTRWLQGIGLVDTSHKG